MRSGMVAGAIILIILGSIVFFSFAAVGDGGDGFCVVGPVVGVVMGILGIVLLIAGLAASPKSEIHPKEQPVQPVYIQIPPQQYQQVPTQHQYQQPTNQAPPPQPTQHHNQQPVHQAPPPQVHPPPQIRMDISDRLSKLNELRERGLISEEEFQMKKQELLKEL